MKTAEEWMREIAARGNGIQIDDETLRAIQLDAAKSGMALAADVANDYDGTGLESQGYYAQTGDGPQTKKDIHTDILAARDRLTAEQLNPKV